MPFSDKQLADLQADLDPTRIKTRRKQGVELRYVEGHDVIDVANDLFGYHAWSYTVSKLDYAAGCWIATILLAVRTQDGETATREDVGVGIPAAARDTDAGPDAHETAIKGAVTDALKRALRTFGNAFGNSLYGKEDAPHADAGQANEPQPARPTVSRSHDGETRACPTCQKPMLWKEGVSKAGKPYAGWFCSDRACNQKPLFGDAHAAPPPPLRVVQPEPAAVAAAGERVVSVPAAPIAGDERLGDVRGPKLAARLRAALGAQGYSEQEAMAWVRQAIAASDKAGLPAFTVTEGKALLDRANAAAAPVAAERSN